MSSLFSQRNEWTRVWLQLSGLIRKSGFSLPFFFKFYLLSLLLKLFHLIETQKSFNLLIVNFVKVFVFREEATRQEWLTLLTSFNDRWYPWLVIQSLLCRASNHYARQSILMNDPNHKTCLIQTHANTSNSFRQRVRFFPHEEIYPLCDYYDFITIFFL